MLSDEVVLTMNDEQRFYLGVRASVQRALVGEIDASMRAISFECSRQIIEVFLYFDGPIGAEVVEDFDAGAMTQIVADYPHPERDGPWVRLSTVRCDRPQSLPIRGTLVFAMKDSTYDYTANSSGVSAS